MILTGINWLFEPIWVGHKLLILWEYFGAEGADEIQVFADLVNFDVVTVEDEARREPEVAGFAQWPRIKHILELFLSNMAGV